MYVCNYVGGLLNHVLCLDQPSLTNLLVLGSCNAILFLSQQQSQVNNKIKPHMFHGSWLILVWLMAWTGWDVM